MSAIWRRCVGTSNRPGAATATAGAATATAGAATATVGAATFAFKGPIPPNTPNPQRSPSKKIIPPIIAKRMQHQLGHLLADLLC